VLRELVAQSQGNLIPEVIPDDFGWYLTYMRQADS